MGFGAVHYGMNYNSDLEVEENMGIKTCTYKNDKYAILNNEPLQSQFDTRKFYNFIMLFKKFIFC